MNSLTLHGPFDNEDTAIDFVQDYARAMNVSRMYADQPYIAELQLDEVGYFVAVGSFTNKEILQGNAFDLLRQQFDQNGWHIVAD